MTRTDYSYIGSGRILARLRGAEAPYREIGNCSALTFGVEQETKRLRDFRAPGGGTYNQVDRITGVTINVTAHDLSPDNLALALYGTVDAVAGGAVVNEAHVAYVGGYIVLQGQPSAVTAVTNVAGSTTYVAGTDYIFQHGAIYIPVTSTIPTPANATTANVHVDYTGKAGDVVEALAGSAEELELVFLGLNEADSGSAVTVYVYRGKFGATQNLGLIGDDYAALEMSGAIMADASKTGDGISQYFRAFIEA